MRITTEHQASSFGVPVILDDDGTPMDTGPGVRAVRHRLGMSRAELGAACGKSPRTVEEWEHGRRNPPASALTVMGRQLAVVMARIVAGASAHIEREGRP